jgi:hypothetical protein
MPNLDKLLNLRMQVTMDMERYVEDGFDPLELAAILVTQGLLIYRQVLTDDEYDIMVGDIYDSRAMVKKVIP